MAEYFADSLFNAFEKADPDPGSLLVASPDLPDPRFRRSVVLVADRGEHGTLGVNLVQRCELAVANVFPDWLHLVAKPQAVYLGGPVDTDRVVGIGVTRPGVDIASTPGVDRLANRLVQVDLNRDPETLGEVLESLRFYAGHAAWGPGQLEEELDRGDWFVAPALISDVIAPGGADVWADVLRRQQMPLSLFSTHPAALENN